MTEKAGSVRGMTEATDMTATAASRRRRTTEEPPVGTRDDRAGRNYCVGGPDTEESAAESTEWSGEGIEELES